MQYIYFLFASLCIGFVSSCSPSDPVLQDVGSEFLPLSEVRYNVETINIQPSVHFVVDTLKTGSNLLFGKFKDPLDNVFTLVGFTKFRYNFDANSLVKPVSTSLVLASSFSPVPARTITFDIYTTAEPWAMGDVRFSSSIPLGEKLTTKPVIISTADTSKSIIYSLPESFTRKVFDAIKDKERSFFGDKSNLGIALVPQGETSIIKLDLDKSKLMFTFDQSTKTGIERKTVLMDFVSSSYTSSQQNSNYAEHANEGIFLSSSILNVANIGFQFDNEMAGAQIVSAELRLFKDTTFMNLVPSTSEDRDVVIRLTSSNDFSINRDVEEVVGVQDTASDGKKIESQYRFNVTKFVQKWATTPDENLGFQILPKRMLSDFSLIKFYYKNPPKESLRPRLTTNYIKLND